MTKIESLRKEKALAWRNYISHSNETARLFQKWDKALGLFADELIKQKNEETNRSKRITGANGRAQAHT